MKISTEIPVRGDVQIFKDGKLLLEKKNLIVTVGKTFLADAFLGAAGNAFNYVGVGTGTASPAITDTALSAEIARVAFTSVTQVDNVITTSTAFTAGVATGTWAEAGIFNDSSAGTLFSRVTFSSISKGALDSVVVNWVITIG
jgi:hypothetical protein